jgi:hypothetical protein
MLQVQNWISETEILLKHYSLQASTRFMRDEHGNSLGYQAIAYGREWWYAKLQMHLTNLDDIIERADDYL